MNSNEPEISTNVFLKSMLQLIKQQKHVEKIVESLLMSVRNSLGIYFFHTKQELQRSLMNERRSIKKYVIKINVACKTFKKNVSDKNKLRERDMLYFKNAILNIEQDLSALKMKSNSETERLKIEENELTAELGKLTANKELFDNNHIEYNRRIMKRSPVHSNKCKSKEVANFMDFIFEHGGHEGGWGVDDHQIFVKHYHQNEKNIINLIKILQHFLPEKSDEAVIEHVEWYLEYQDKKEQYKKAINEWRQNKRKEKLTICSSTTDVFQPVIDRLYESKMNTRLKVVDKNVKEKIKEWKERKLKMLEAENKKILKNSKKGKINHIRKPQEKIDMKLKVAKWKEEKMLAEKQRKNEQEQTLELEKHTRLAEAKRLIKEYQEQDRTFLERRLELKSATAGAKETLRKTKSLASIHVERDPDRLHRATKQWLAKIQPSLCDVNKSSQNLLNIYNVPKLRKPDWIGALPCI